jgi:hypothetical protein
MLSRGTQLSSARVIICGCEALVGPLRPVLTHPCASTKNPAAITVVPMAKMAVERRKLLMSLILPQCADIAACEYPVEVEMRLRFHEQSKHLRTASPHGRRQLYEIDKSPSGITAPSG